MSRITIFFHGEMREKAGKERAFFEANSIKELFAVLSERFPNLLEDMKYRRITCLVNGRNIETLKKDETLLEDFDLVGITLKDGGLVDFFPPDGGG